MKAFLKNYLLLSKYVFEKHKKLLVQFFMFLFCVSSNAQRIGNYVANGSFEEHYDCNIPYNIIKAKGWMGIDSSDYCHGGVWLSVCNGRVPKAGGSVYQYPHSGEAYLSSGLYWLNNLSFSRTYAKNRLKATLQAGKGYCVKFYVNIENGSTYGIDGFGAYFGSNEIDTITKCQLPITYFLPQVQNPQGNIITDTLNWVAITGTFTANGTEKFLLLGNFLSDANTDTLMINPTNLPIIFSSAGFDEISCIPIDLEAYAGRDTTIFLNDSVYIGRELDFAIDSGCVWYKLPSTTAIDTISGMWVKPPIGTHTYVVRQELECSPLKWDTVIVNVKYNDVGLQELIANSRKFIVELFPNPASDMITVKTDKYREEISVSVFDVTGKTVLNKKVAINNYVAGLELNLENGIYTICFTDKVKKIVTKKLVVAK